MCRAISVIICVIMGGVCAGLSAQIPEGVQFQPGSYMVPYRSVPRPAIVGLADMDPSTSLEDAVDALANDEEETDDSTTEWEAKFSPQTIESVSPAVLMPQPYEVPHLTFVYNHWTRRFHIAPYEPGYAACPAAFPGQTSPLHVWVSSASSAAQLHPQVPYMSYYDPDPVVLPAEIRLYGTKILSTVAMQPQVQPMPLPAPRPDMAIPAAPPARTRLGERIRQTTGTFFLPR